MNKKQKIFELNEAFKLFDKKGAKKINYFDTEALLRLCNYYPSDSDLKSFKQRYCIDNKLYLKDFHSICDELDSKYSEDQFIVLENSFKMLDYDTDYKISVKDMKYFLSTYGEQFSNEDINYFIMISDPYNTGYIEYNKFINTIKNKLINNG